MLGCQVEWSPSSIMKTLAITGTIRALSKEKLYREWGLVSFDNVKFLRDFYVYNIQNTKWPTNPTDVVATSQSSVCSPTSSELKLLKIYPIIDSHELNETTFIVIF